MKNSVLILFLLLHAGQLPAASEVDELIKRGAAHDDQRKANDALKYYLPAEKLEPDNAGLMVRIARQYSYLMTEASTDSEKMQLGTTALAYAERAVKLDPNLCEAHLSVAICHGKMLPLMGTRRKLELSRIIKDEADKAVALDPKNDLAWHLLGRWHQELATLGGAFKAVAQLIYGKIPTATNEESAKCFEKAIALNPNRLMHCIELGRTYAQMHRDDEAKKMINKGLAMPNREKEDPESKERGRQALKKLES